MIFFGCTFARIRTVLSALALGGLALAAQATTTDIYYHNDLAGTPMAATDGAGNVLWRQGYKPYGERLDPKAPADQLPWFTGKAHVEAEGLSYFGARWYDPVLGRFMGVDPAGFSEANLHSFNRYAYANNNPYKFVDPDGRSAEEIFANWPIAPLGRFAGAAAAWAQGVATGNAALRAEGAAGMAENRSGAAEAALIIGSTGRGGRGRASEALPDNAIVCRGGTCTADRFASGSGVTLDSSGRLQGVSVNSAAGKSVEELIAGIPNRQVGVTTAGEVRKAGGDVVPSPTPGNPYHCTLCGLAPKQAEKLMTPTIRNPN
jgi:RHS repeat-associated protein